MRQLLVVLFGAMFPLAQDAPEFRIYSAAWFPPNLTISADANLVEMGATVRDRQQHLVAGLKAADFEVLDNKQPREITFFEERKSGAARPAPDGTARPVMPLPDPRSIALFFDDAHDNVWGMRKSAEAADKLIRDNLHAGDRVGVFTASGAVSVDFTSDRDQLLAALARLIPRPLSGATPESRCPTLNAWQAYAVIEHVDPEVEQDAMLDAAICYCPKPITPACRNEQRITVQSMARMVWSLSKFRSTTTLDAIGIVIRHLAAEPGSRMLILMTPAFPSEKGMEAQTSALLDSALRANIRMSTMHMAGKGVPFDIARHEFLGQAAKATGGQIVDGYYDPNASLRDLVSEPAVSYVLGFSPGEPDGLNHTLKTRIVGNRGLSVESRSEYFSVKPAGETTQQRIDRIALSNEEKKDFPASLAPRQDGDEIHVTIAIDAKALPFREKEGRRIEELTFVTILEDSQGGFVSGKESVMDLAFTSATLAEKLQKGIDAATSLTSPRPGSYRVREVIREAVEDRMWAGAVAIEVR